jgi:AcrR family transcriptional regulator
MSISGDGVAAARPKRGARTRERLLGAAKAVFEEIGLQDARVSQISERAGLSYGSFYHYFDSKEEVFREVAREVGRALTASMDIIMDRESGAPPRQRLTAAIRDHFEAYRTEARMLSVIDQVARQDEAIATFWNDVVNQRRKNVEDGIEALQRHGKADPALDPTIAAAALGAMIFRFADQWLVQGYPECDFDTGVEQITKLFLNALGIHDNPTVPGKP